MHFIYQFGVLCIFGIGSFVMPAIKWLRWVLVTLAIVSTIICHMFFFLFGRSIITLDLCSSFNDDYEFAYSKESSDVVRCSNAAMRYELDTTLQIHFFFFASLRNDLFLLSARFGHFSFKREDSHKEADRRVKRWSLGLICRDIRQLLEHTF